jgi:Rrf2 family cysteine metabolism transcriptional repressor
MYHLAIYNNGEPIPLKYIAEKQDIPEHYLERLMSSLRKSGLVKSVRGARGGYILAKKPCDISVGDVLRVLEGPIGIVDCVSEKDAAKCTKAQDCITRIVWEKIRDNILGIVDSITLQDMCKEAEKHGTKSIKHI